MTLVAVTTGAAISTDLLTQARGPFWLDDIGVIIFTPTISGAGPSVGCRAIYTDDGGATWITVASGGPPTIGGASGSLAAVPRTWYERNTPGRTANKLHVMYGRTATTPTTAVGIGYYRFDMDSLTWDAVGVEIQSAFSGSSRCMTITMARDGTLYAIGDSTTRAKKSTDGGSNWTDIANPLSGEDILNDYIEAYPANTGDDADICVIFTDQSAGTVTIKMYDASEDTWTESSIASITGSTTHPAGAFGASVRHSDGHLLVGVWTNVDNAAADLKTYDINVNSIASPTVTTKTDIITTADNGDDKYYCDLWINQQNDDVRVTICGLKDGSQTIGSSVGVYSYLSTDDMGTWGSETAYGTSTLDDYRWIHGGLGVTSVGGYWMPLFFDDDDNDIFVDPDNAVRITPSSTTINVAASIAAAMTVAGAARATRFAAATVTGAMSIVAALGEKQLIAATIDGVATVTGTVLSKQFISSTINGIATVSGTLAQKFLLAALVTGAADVAGALLPRRLLAALIEGAATVAGALRATLMLASLVSGAATVTATLAEKFLLAALVTGNAVTSGTVQSKLFMQAALTMVGNASGTLVSKIGLSSLITGVATVTGTITPRRTLAALVTGVATVSGSLRATHFVSALVTGVAIVSGTAAIKKLIASVVTGVATVSGTIRQTLQIQAALTLAATITGTINRRVLLAANISPQASIQAALRATRTLAASLLGTGTLQATLTRTGVLAASLAGAASVSATVQLKRTLAALITGSATVSATAIFKHGLKSAIAMVASIIARLNRPTVTVLPPIEANIHFDELLVLEVTHTATELNVFSDTVTGNVTVDAVTATVQYSDVIEGAISGN